MKEYKDIFSIWNYELIHHYPTAIKGIAPALFINDFNTAIKKLSENVIKRTPTKTEVVLQTNQIGSSYKDKRASLINKFLGNKVK